MNNYRWWRKLRGGVWILSWQRWNKIHPDNYGMVKFLTIFRIEDNRWWK